MVVATRGERVVADVLEMAAQALGDGVGDHRGDDLAELGVAERQLDLGGVELVHADVDALLVGEHVSEVVHAVHELAGVVLAVKHDEARALLAQLDGAVEELGGVDGLGLDPLHLLEDAHGVVVGLAPEHAGTNHHVVVDVLEVLGHGGAALVLGVLGLDEVRGDVAELLHEGVVLGEGAGVLEEAGDQRDLVGVDGLAQDVVLGEAEELVVGVLGGRGVVVGDVHQRAGALLLAELGGLDDLGGGAGTGGEDADRVLVEGLGRAREELGGDLAVDVDVGRGGLDPVLHRERVGPGAAAADEEDVGIALLADLVHGGLNLGTESEGIAHNLLVTRLIEIEHI